MENETDLIRNQMLETRTALSEKLEALQGQVLATVQGTTETVTETVETVQEAVETTVQTVTDSVQETVETVRHTLDLSEQVNKHPWLMLGGAVFVGYLGGRLLESAGRPEGVPPSSNGAAPSRSPQGPARLSWLESVVGPLMQQAQGLALGALTGVVSDLVQAHSPEGMKGQLGEMLKQFTDSLGVEPLHGLVATDGPAANTPKEKPPARPSGTRSDMPPLRSTGTAV